MMIAVDLMTKIGRMIRPIVDHFASALPFVGLLLQRVGAVGGVVENVRALLEAGERVLIFPEGVPGISKPRAQRYQLAPWRVGHVEMALRHRVPVIPVAVIGAEEQMPVLWNSKFLGRLFGLPHLPVTLVPLPLPVKYRIAYGAPVELSQELDPDNPRDVRQAAAQTQAAVEALIANGLRQRSAVFW